jgi:hypothetical protein
LPALPTTRVTAPSLDDLIAACRLNGFEAKVLSAIWAGRGLSVQTSVIFDAMYQDDIDGGPSQTRMYVAFYAALRSLNSKLNGGHRNQSCRLSRRMALDVALGKFGGEAMSLSQELRTKAREIAAAGLAGPVQEQALQRRLKRKCSLRQLDAGLPLWNYPLNLVPILIF